MRNVRVILSLFFAVFVGTAVTQSALFEGYKNEAVLNKPHVDIKNIKYQYVKKFKQLSAKNKKIVLWIAKSKLKIKKTGFDGPVDYTKYGKIKNPGTKKYKYKIKDIRGLKKAVGDGIFPNWSAIKRYPEFRILKKTGVFGINHWDKIFMRYPKLGFYRWIVASEASGVKQFYIANALENSGHNLHALKAYQAVFMHYPGTFSFTEWQTPWYPGTVSRDKIFWLLRRKTGKRFRLIGSSAFNQYAYDNTLTNDKLVFNPGRFIKAKTRDYKDTIGIKRKIKKSIGLGDSKLIQYKNGHWQYYIKGKPTLIKAIAYQPTKIGFYPDGKRMMNVDCFTDDSNKNGVIDGLYESFIDRNRNGKRDADEPMTSDIKLMKEMGVNVIRLYHHGPSAKPEILMKLYKEHGMRFIIGDLLGMYGIGSGASWEKGTNYKNPVHRKRMLASVKKLLDVHKNQPYVLMWMIGNENNFPVANNAHKIPGVYYKFVNKVAKIIRKADSLKRPIAHSNGDQGFLNYFAKYCKDVDVYGANTYRDYRGFGSSFYEAVKKMTGLPVIITEYGIGAYTQWHSRKVAEDYQALYHRRSWQDIVYHSANHYGVGNSIGGVAFEFLDEWWKHEGTRTHRIKDRAAAAKYHDTESSFPLSGLDGLSYEEWFGMFGQGKGTASSFLRIPRKAFYVYKELWNK